MFHRTFADADPIPLVLAHLAAHPRVLAALGGPDHISGLREAPWPHLQVVAGDGGSIAGMEAGAIAAPADFTVWGHPDGRHGNAALRRAAFVVIEACQELADTDHVPGQAVISVADFDGHPTSQQLSNGQNRWQFTARFTIAPPTEGTP